MITIKDRLYVHVHAYGPFTLSTYKHYINVMRILEDQLRDRGVEKLYTYVSSLPKFRFAQFFGFGTCYEVFNISGTDFEIMSKDLN